jgi:hypothetical protein
MQQDAASGADMTLTSRQVDNGPGDPADASTTRTMRGSFVAHRFPLRRPELAAQTLVVLRARLDATDLQRFCCGSGYANRGYSGQLPPSATRPVPDVGIS